MHRLSSALCTAILLAACHQPTVATTVAAHPDTPSSNGKIPLTTSSPAALELFLRGRALNEALQAHEGYLLFRQAHDLDSNFAMAEYSMATTAFTGTERASRLQRALRLAPHVSPGERLLIQALQARVNADPDAVRGYAQSLVAQYPRDERAHWVLGNALLAQLHYAAAAAEYRTAIAINPEYSLAYNSLGYAYRPAGDLAAAEAAFRRYIALVPRDPNPYDSYAELLMKAGRFDESITQYRKALAIDPHFGGSYVGIAADAMYAGRHAESIAEARAYYAAARDDGERRTALLTEALTELDRGATDDALATMQRRYQVAEAAGDTANMAADGIQVADILLAAGRTASARDRYLYAHDLIKRSSLSAAIKEDDELGRHYDAGRVALASHDLPTARSEANAFTSGAAAHHNDARIRLAHEFAGLLALESHAVDEALAELARADQLSPTVLYGRGRAYGVRGDQRKARQLASQAAALNELPTIQFVLIRAKARQLAAGNAVAATASATSGTAHETPH